MCQNTGCSDCQQSNSNCGCSCNSCSTNNCDGCVVEACSCDFEMDTSCIRYSGPELECIDVSKGETLEQSLSNINDIVCTLSSGVDGENGDTAYEIWLNLGNVGTEQDFIDSLQGADGINGVDGADGADGADGSDGVDGTNGLDGQDVDHTSFLVSNLGGAAGQPGATDTYTLWGNPGETINLGTYQVYNGLDGSVGAAGTGVDHVNFTSSSLGGAASQQGAIDTYTIWGDLAETINLGTHQVYNGVDGVDGADGLDAVIPDSGWVDLEGFDYYTGVDKPQCRRIGNQIHFRGLLTPPLSSTIDGLTKVDLSSTNAYISQPFPFTYTGPLDGVTINSNGSIVFNNDTGVIPASVTTAAAVDGEYSLGSILGYRNILLSDGITGHALTTVVSVYMTADKKLAMAPLRDTEIVPTSGANAFGSMPTRLITSNVRVGEFVPNYIAAASDIHNAPSNANFSLVSDTHNLTYVFDCDAGRAENLAGFFVRLDGLSVFLT